LTLSEFGFRFRILLTPRYM